jgi:hypothetical protein
MTSPMFQNIKPMHMLLLVTFAIILYVYTTNEIHEDIAEYVGYKAVKYIGYENPRYHINNTITLNGHCKEHKRKKHLIYMFITDVTDILYHENLKISSEIVFISEVEEHCPKTSCCLTVQTGYDYWSLDKKVELALKVMSNTFENFITLTKMDDDVFLDYNYFMSLQQNFTENTFYGKFETQWCPDQMAYAEGSSYTVSRRLIQCLLFDYHTCGNAAEDMAVSSSIYRNCKNYERRDLREFYNIFVFHKTYARKNKVIYLANTNADTASLMFVYNPQGPSLD